MKKKSLELVPEVFSTLCQFDTKKTLFEKWPSLSQSQNSLYGHWQGCVRIFLKVRETRSFLETTRLLRGSTSLFRFTILECGHRIKEKNNWRKWKLDWIKNSTFFWFYKTIEKNKMRYPCFHRYLDSPLIMQSERLFNRTGAIVAELAPSLKSITTSEQRLKGLE